jgi:hypothetical protein
MRDIFWRRELPGGCLKKKVATTKDPWRRMSFETAPINSLPETASKGKFSGGCSKRPCHLFRRCRYWSREGHTAGLWPAVCPKIRGCLKRPGHPFRRCCSALGRAHGGPAEPRAPSAGRSAREESFETATFHEASALQGSFETSSEGIFGCAGGEPLRPSRDPAGPAKQLGRIF